MNKKRTWPTFFQKLTEARAIRPYSREHWDNKYKQAECEKKGPIYALHFGLLRWLKQFTRVSLLDGSLHYQH